MSDHNYPNHLKYAKSDEWIHVEGETATIGISDYAQDSLNDLVYVEFKEVGESIAAGESFGEIESVKAASEVYLPVAGEIIAVNEALESEPDTVNSDPYGDGWMIKIKITDESNLNHLMDASAYQAYCESR